MKTAQCSVHSFRRQAGFSMVEMIGVLAIIAILAVVIVPKVFSTISSARITNAAASINSLKSAVTDFAGKYGTIPNTVATSRIDDLLVAAGLLESRFQVKIGTQQVNRPAGVWTNTAGTWTAAGGSNQATAPAQTRVICINSTLAAPNTAAGANYQLDGVNNLPAGSRVVSAVLVGVPINDARELSVRVDGDALSQPTGAVTPDAAGRVVYGAAAAGLVTVYTYVVHQ